MKQRVEPGSHESSLIWLALIKREGKLTVLIYGEMPSQLPLHVVCDLSDEDVMYIPTVYIPSKEDWVRFQIRKRKPRKR